MEDELKAMRRKKKVAGIDDPVVIIQRILNIFRQLHILDDTAKENFNKMILQQPPEIRHMCSVLPGGSLLQEYVDELEEAQGIAPDQLVDSVNDLTSDEEESKDTILANAMAADDTPKGQVTPAQKVSETIEPVSAPVNEDTQKQMLMMMQAMQNNIQQQAPAATNATIKTDPNFAKEIANAISSALATSDQERRKETQELTKSLTDSQMQMTKVLVNEISKTTVANANAPVATTDTSGVKIIDNTQAITKAITESQLEMAKMFLQHNAISASASNSSSNNANNIQINTGANTSNSPELIGDIIKAQSQLFREMAKEQTKELSAIISVSLRETSQQNNKQLINALSAFQKENLKFFKEQAKNRPAAHYQIPINDGNTVYEYVEQEFPEEEITVASEEPSYIKKVLGNVFNRSHDRVENKPQTSLTMTEDEPVEPIVPVQTLQTFEDQTTDISKDDIADENSLEIEFESENDNDDYEINSDGLGLSTAETPSKKKKRKKKKNRNKNISELENSDANANGYQPIFAQNATQQKSKEEKEEWDFDQIVAPSPKNSFDLDSSLFDLDNMEASTSQIQIKSDDKDDHKEFLSKLDMSVFGVQNNREKTDFTSEISTAESDSSHNLQIDLGKTSDIFADQQPLEDDNIIEASWEDQTQENADLLTENFSEELIEDFSKDLSENFSEVEAENTSDELDLKDTDFEELAFETTDQAEELIEPPHQGYVNRLRQDLNDQIAIEESLTPSTAEIGQPQNIDPNLSYKSNLDLNAAAEAENDDSNSEWEWEYEEVSEEELTTQQPIEAQTANEEDGEWEWEYEEVSEEEVTTQPPIEAQAANEEEGEWEWEYEEVLEEDGATQQPIEAQTANEEDGEWEWEYEEVLEEDGTTHQPIEVQTANEEEGEWEWEYEESSEEDASIKTSNVFSNKEISTIEAEVSNLDIEDANLTDDDLKSLENELGNQEDIGFVGLFGDPEQEEDIFSNSDPYAGGHIPANNEDLSLNSLQSGSLYFQEDVTKTKETQNKSSTLFDDLESDLLLPEFSDDDHIDEPYKLNSDIKP